MKATWTEDTGDETNSSDDEIAKNVKRNRLPPGSVVSGSPSEQKDGNDTIANPTISTVDCQLSVSQEKPSIAAPMVDEREHQLLLAQECFDNGMSRWSDAEYDLAMPLFLRSLEIREDILGKLHDDTAKSYLWVGSIHWHRTEHEQALDNFSRCFRIRFYLHECKSKCGIVCTWIEKVLDAVGEDAPAYWQYLLSSIKHERKGDLCTNDRLFDNAIVEYQSALRFEFHRVGAVTSTRNRSLIDVADIHCKIAYALLALGSCERAMMEYRHALRTYFDTFGLHQASTKKKLQQMSTVGEILGFRKEAVNSYMGVLHDAIHLEKIADLHLDNKEYAAALRKYDRVLQYEDQGMGHLQGYYGVICNKLAECHRRVGRTDEAMRLACTAFGIFSRVLGSNHQETLAILQKIHKLAGPRKPRMKYQLETGEVWHGSLKRRWR